MFLLLLPDWWGTATGIFGLVCLVGAALIVLLSRKKEEALASEKASNEALKRLLETRSTELADEKAKVAKLEEEKKKLATELEATGDEYKQLASLDIQGLIKLLHAIDLPGLLRWLMTADLKALVRADELRRENESLRGDVQFWKGKRNES